MIDTLIDISDLFDNDIKKIRMTPDKKAAAIDIVMLVTGKNNKDSADIIRKLEKSEDFIKHLPKFQFSGPGQRPIHVIDATDANELITITPGKIAMAFRRESSKLLTRVFAGDPKLHDLLNKNALVGDPMQTFLNHLADVTPAVMTSVKLGEGGETEGHDECKHWVATNINNIAFATGVCPTCSTPILGLSVVGGLTAVEHITPGTNYRADVLVRLDQDTHVAIEVAHTHLISAKKMFECKQAGNTVYEVETKEIKRAIMEQQPFSTHVLFTTCIESVPCEPCKKRARIHEM
jgi:hypothetical protein